MVFFEKKFFLGRHYTEKKAFSIIVADILGAPERRVV